MINEINIVHERHNCDFASNSDENTVQAGESGHRFEKEVLNLLYENSRCNMDVSSSGSGRTI